MTAVLREHITPTVAHSLVSTTDGEIKRLCGRNTHEIVVNTAEVLSELYKTEYGGNPNNGYFDL